MLQFLGQKIGTIIFSLIFGILSTLLIYSLVLVAWSWSRTEQNKNTWCLIYLNVVLRWVKIFINLGQATIHIPQQDHPKRRCSAQHALKMSNHTDMIRNTQMQKRSLLLVYLQFSVPWSLFLYNHLLPSSVNSLSCPNAALTKPFTKEEARFIRAESTWEPLPPNPWTQKNKFNWRVDITKHIKRKMIHSSLCKMQIKQFCSIWSTRLDTCN